MTNRQAFGWWYLHSHSAQWTPRLSAVCWSSCLCSWWVHVWDQLTCLPASLATFCRYAQGTQRHSSWWFIWVFECEWASCWIHVPRQYYSVVCPHSSTFQLPSQSALVPCVYNSRDLPHCCSDKFTRRELVCLSIFQHKWTTCQAIWPDLNTLW